MTTLTKSPGSSPAQFPSAPCTDPQAKDDAFAVWEAKDSAFGKVGFHTGEPPDRAFLLSLSSTLIYFAFFLYALPVPQEPFHQLTCLYR